MIATLTPSSDIIAKARELRRQHPTMGAANRLRWARADVKQAALWSDLKFDHNRTARIERDGFTIHAQYTYDDYADSSWLGYFSDKWKPGAIKNLSGWYNNYTEPSGDSYAWFIPENGADEPRQWYAKAGYARHDAWLTAQRQVREDYERATNVTLYVLKVTVFRAGIELAVDCVGGIDLGDDLPNVDVDEQAVTVAIESIDTALFEAKAAMKTIAIEFTKDATIN